ncbi:hypothetical protein [Synechococcus sp. PCC 6312]|uniref:hypothetical protein n=1 Tax=Synechococcus sp. (strain ATCC 27167 / PCC 6312) TaxID=195253 RepID=UPI00029F0016|nr:hypothetical protein [Synechococcus sp. PCC 6312]AFY59578.1 hypothetical protein Syn6312_0345 [Synechococcus sp. PCC 6312]
MEDKQKATLYLSSDLHKQLKVTAAVQQENMSDLAERAISFYLCHPEVVAEVEAQEFGATHRVYACPECATAVVMRGDQLVSLINQPTVLDDAHLTVPALQNELVAAR